MAVRISNLSGYPLPVPLPIGVIVPSGQGVSTRCTMAEVVAAFGGAGQVTRLASIVSLTEQQDSGEDLPAVARVATRIAAPMLSVDVQASAELVRYLRPDGKATNSGASELDAWPGTVAGLRQWVASLAMQPSGLRQVLDLTGCDIAEAAQFNLGEYLLGPISDDYDPDATGPDQFASRAAYQLRATPELVLEVTVDSTAADVDSGCYTVTVDQVLVANEHKRQLLIGSGLGEWGAIEDNGTGTLKVAQASIDPATWTAPIAIYEAGASLSFGDPEKTTLPAFNLTAHGTWFFTGIAFNSPDALIPAVTVRGPGEAYLQLCEIDGLHINGSGYTYVDGSAVTGRFNTSGGNFIVRTSVLSELAFLCHQGGTYADFSESLISEHTTPVGGGISKPLLSFALLKCEVKNGAGDGVAAGGQYVRLTDVKLSDNAGAGVACSNGATVVLANVGGSGNEDVGIDLGDGARVELTGGTNVTGDLGDIRCGATGIIAYAAVPEVDLVELCRIY